jgi:hypothetical protein
MPVVAHYVRSKAHSAKRMAFLGYYFTLCAMLYALCDFSN